MKTIAEVRPSPIAGLWYSGNPKDLSQEVDSYLRDAALPALNGEVIAVIVPHAGIRYSGRTAAYAFAAVAGQKRDLVAVVSPYHDYYPLPLITSAHQAYSNPLGQIWIDKPAVSSLEEILMENSGFALSPIANDREHSLEIELPFLQRTLTNDFKLLPVMIHSLSQDISRALGSALAKVLDSRSALLVASSDLSHFYPEEEANRLDRFMLDQIASFSPENVLNAEFSGRGYACGVGAIVAVLWAAKELGANDVIVLNHNTSGDTTGDRTSVVGYGAAVVLKR